MTVDKRGVEYYAGTPADDFDHQLVFESDLAHSPVGNVVLSWANNGDVSLDVEVNHNVTRHDRIDPAEDLAEQLRGYSDHAQPSRIGVRVFSGNLKEPLDSGLKKEQLRDALSNMADDRLIPGDIVTRVFNPTGLERITQANGRVLQNLAKLTSSSERSVV